MKVSALRAVTALRTALEESGLPRTSRMAGAEMRGWVDRNTSGSTGFSIRPLAGGKLAWHVVVSGKPHLRYRSFREAQGDGDIMEMSEPTNPEVLFPRIAKAFESIGIKAENVKWAIRIDRLKRHFNHLVHRQACLSDSFARVD